MHSGRVIVTLPAGSTRKQRGYFEGQNLKLEWRFADNKTERLDGLAVDLVQRKVDVIVAGGTPPTLSTAKATAKIPIISVGGTIL